MSFYAECMLHKVKPLIAIIEKASTGVTLISSLEGVRGLNIREVKRTKASGSKTARFLEMQPIVSAKLISFTYGAKHVDLCINHMSKITANDSHRHDDICDTLYDAIKPTLIDKTIINTKLNQTDYNSMARSLNSTNNKINNLKQKAYK
jgi:predicted phage terminase large subunit-like protein